LRQWLLGSLVHSATQAMRMTSMDWESKADCLNQAHPAGDPPCDLSTRVESEFAQDVLHMHFNCALDDQKPLCNILIAQPVGHQARNLPFA
jgi:hypothetical protein